MGKITAKQLGKIALNGLAGSFAGLTALALTTGSSGGNLQNAASELEKAEIFPQQGYSAVGIGKTCPTDSISEFVGCQTKGFMQCDFGYTSGTYFKLYPSRSEPELNKPEVSGVVCSSPIRETVIKFDI